MVNIRFRILFLLTPFFILFSHYLAVFPHEYAHSFMAWVLGYKSNPLDIEYGGTSIWNILLLSNINENVDCQRIYSLGHGMYVALIAFAGPGIANGLLFILSFFLLKNQKVQRQPYLFYFLFWFNLMNLGNFYDYVPIGTFSSQGDMADIRMGLNISPWWIYIPFGYLVVFLIWQFFAKTLIMTYATLKLTTISQRATVMVICVFILFGFFGRVISTFLSPNPMNYFEISHFLSITSFLIIPIAIVALWPTREWVDRRLSAFYSENFSC